MTLDTWISLVVLVTALSGMYVALRHDITGLRDELKGDHATLREELRNNHAALREELKADIARVEERVEKLDDRVYALAVGLRPLIERAEHGEAS